MALFTETFEAEVIFASDNSASQYYFHKSQFFSDEIQEKMAASKNWPKLKVRNCLWRKTTEYLNFLLYFQIGDTNKATFFEIVIKNMIIVKSEETIAIGELTKTSRKTTAQSLWFMTLITWISRQWFNVFAARAQVLGSWHCRSSLGFVKTRVCIIAAQSSDSQAASDMWPWWREIAAQPLICDLDDVKLPRSLWFVTLITWNRRPSLGFIWKLLLGPSKYFQLKSRCTLDAPSEKNEKKKKMKKKTS